MYGYLKPQTEQLAREDYLRYQQYYCGTCCALHDIFGLKYRVFTSYDASFIGLLISSQTIKTENSKKNICSILTNKNFPFDSKELFSSISACISILIANSKILDSVKEKSTFSLKIKQSIFNKSLSKALGSLENNGFYREYFQQLFAEQEISEKSNIVSLLKLTEPTADFIGKLFKYTAMVNGISVNENVLYEIGYDVGSIIYIIDACIDILEDLDRKQFNYLLLNLKDSQAVDSELIQSEPSKIILDAYRRIKINIYKIEFKKNDALIKNILLLGFPDIIIKRLQKSTVEINKKKNIYSKYLPHAAIITGLCLLMPNSSYAEWVWNKTVAQPLDWQAYGCACCTGTNSQNPDADCCGQFGTYIDCIFNPCIYFDTWSHSRNPNLCCGVVCQAPKALFDSAVIFKISKFVKNRSMPLIEKYKYAKLSKRKEIKRSEGNALQKKPANCPYCDVPGNGKCQECHGTGFKFDQECKLCAGSGECKKCYGEGCLTDYDRYN